MNDPELVKNCLSSIKENFDKEVSVKIRLGTDDNDIDETLDNFVDSIKSSGIKVFYVHARKAILKGLTPKQNREIPPLNYERVKKLKVDYSDLEIIINGGIKELDFLKKNDLCNLDGIMIGREVYSNPQILNDVDKILEADLTKNNSLYDITSEMFNYFLLIHLLKLLMRLMMFKEQDKTEVHLLTKLKHLEMTLFQELGVRQLNLYQKQRHMLAK